MLAQTQNKKHLPTTKQLCLLFENHFFMIVYVIIYIFSINIQKYSRSTRDLQLCVGQHVGCEAAVHALSSMFSEDNSNGILLVDADNVFNQINRNIMLHNIQIICLIIATYVINSYSREARHFITDSEEITSAEDPTQCDPTAKPIYALGSLLLLSI